MPIEVTGRRGLREKLICWLCGRKDGKRYELVGGLPACEYCAAKYQAGEYGNHQNQTL